ncbi:uncharacterized protein LOC105183119 [Harpegnathos saltator]|uniref:uncharacterized protein LOC105183119 n=1 Tax=Harpegnathos saltator TaxID=610380 RepID=UPI000DBEF016|nr:uncharacterized protein LOC105183119 [Harpegnathos saltator]
MALILERMGLWRWRLEPSPLQCRRGNPTLAVAVVYWGTEEIAELRDSSIQARRCIYRARRRGEDVTRAQEGYLTTRKALRAAIAEAKRAWEQMMCSLDDDPWGRPYKRVMGKTRPWAPPPTETLDSQAFDGLLDTLFPRVEGGPPKIPSTEMKEEDWEEGLGPEELVRARRKFGGKGKLPAPMESLAEPGLSPSARKTYSRPYAGTCLQRGRISTTVNTDSGLEGLDAIQYLRDLNGAVAEREGGMLLTVSLDIKNAFNTLPWPEIGRALEHHGVPVYLRRILAAYFEDRDLAFPKKGGVQSCHDICYADDTLVAAGGRAGGEARLRAEAAVASVVRTIVNLGLKVAPQKMLASRVRGVGLAVASLLRNLGGPGWRARRLYATAVLSIALYRAPIWAPQLSACRDSLSRMRQALKPMFIRAYRRIMQDDADREVWVYELTLEQLRDQATARGINATGNAATLRARLLRYERAGRRDPPPPSPAEDAMRSPLPSDDVAGKLEEPEFIDRTILEPGRLAPDTVKVPTVRISSPYWAVPPPPLSLPPEEMPPLFVPQADEDLFKCLPFFLTGIALNGTASKDLVGFRGAISK